MKFTRTMMINEIQPRIAAAKATNVTQTWPDPETIKMVNATTATIYRLSVGRLLQWANDEYFEDDQFKLLILSPMAQGPALYQFIDNAGVYLYTGQSGVGVSRIIEHITGGPRANKALYAHIANNRPRSLNYTVVYHALSLSPDLPTEWKERTILAAESSLIKQYPTLLNIQHEGVRKLEI